MIFSYGITQTGLYHIEKQIVCQDSHCYKKIDDHFFIAAVADGLGSEIHSDIASKIAAKKSVNYCAIHLKRRKKPKEILEIIKESFKYAHKLILKRAKENKDDYKQYDTTLALAVYIDGTIYFGNSGDSGIIVLTTDGVYKAITTKQNDDNGYVYPLDCGEDCWEFGTVENVAGMLLATDGIFDTMFPFLIKYSDQDIYNALVDFYMPNRINKITELNQVEIKNKIKDYVSSFTKDQVNDDKTILVMMDLSKEVKYKEKKYYESPDWNALLEKRNAEYFKKAYPNLVRNDS